MNNCIHRFVTPLTTRQISTDTSLLELFSLSIPSMAKLTDMSYEIALRAIAFCFTLLAAVLAIADQESSATANW